MIQPKTLFTTILILIPIGFAIISVRSYTEKSPLDEMKIHIIEQPPVKNEPVSPPDL